MPRIRTIKPEISFHERLYDLELETGLPIRFTWAVFPTHCDREGRFEYRVRALKAQILPYDDVDFSRVLDALWTRGFIEKYEVNGRIYGVISSFLEHQVINNRESASVLPEPNKNNVLTCEGRVRDARVTREVQLQEEGKGKEGKGKRDDDASEPPKGKQKKFTPPTVEQVAEYCSERGNRVDAEKFVAFYSSKGWMVGKNKMVSWKQCVITWEKKDNGQSDGGGEWWQ